MKTLIALILLALTCNINAEFPKTPTVDEIRTLLKQGKIENPFEEPTKVKITIDAEDASVERIFGYVKHVLNDHPDFSYSVTAKTCFSLNFACTEVDTRDESSVWFISCTVVAHYDHSQQHNSEWIGTFTSIATEETLKKRVTDVVGLGMTHMTKHLWVNFEDALKEQPKGTIPDLLKRS